MRKLKLFWCIPEDGALYLGVASPAKPVGCNILEKTRCQSPRFTGSIVTYSTLEAAAHSHLPATFDTPRNSIISPGEELFLLGTHNSYRPSLGTHNNYRPSLGTQQLPSFIWHTTNSALHFSHDKYCPSLLTRKILPSA